MDEIGIWTTGGMIMRGEKTEVLRHKPVPMPLLLLQIPHGMTWYRTQVSEVRAASKKELLLTAQLSQKFSAILWTLKFHHRVHNSPTVVRIFSWINPAHILTY
jgi:hypothetical protein